MEHNRILCQRRAVEVVGFRESFTQRVSEKKGGGNDKQTRRRGDTGTRRIEIPPHISFTLTQPIIEKENSTLSFVFMVQVTDYLYVVRDDQILNNEPIIKGTRTPVRAVVETWRMGVPPEEIPIGMPHLTLAQVFGALTLINISNKTKFQMSCKIRFDISRA